MSSHEPFRQLASTIKVQLNVLVEMYFVRAMI